MVNEAQINQNGATWYLIYGFPLIIKLAGGIGSAIFRMTRPSSSHNSDYIASPIFGGIIFGIILFSHISSNEVDILTAVDKNIYFIVSATLFRVFGLLVCYPFWSVIASLKLGTIVEYIELRYESKLLTNIFNFCTAFITVNYISNVLSEQQTLYFNLFDLGAPSVIAITSFIIILSVTIGGLRSVLINAVVDYLFIVIGYACLVMESNRNAQKFEMVVPPAKNACYIPIGITTFFKVVMEGLVLQMFYEVFKYCSTTPLNTKILVGVSSILYAISIAVSTMCAMYMKTYTVTVKKCFGVLMTNQYTLAINFLHKMDYKNVSFQVTMTGLSTNYLKQLGINMMSLLRQSQVSVSQKFMKKHAKTPSDIFIMNGCLITTFGFLMISIIVLSNTDYLSNFTLANKTVTAHVLMPILTSIVIMAPLFPNVTEKSIKCSFLLTGFVACIFSMNSNLKTTYFNSAEESKQRYFKDGCKMIGDKRCAIGYITDIFPFLVCVINIGLTVLVSHFMNDRKINKNKNLYFGFFYRIWENSQKKLNTNVDDDVSNHSILNDSNC